MGLIFLAFFLAVAQTNLNNSPPSTPTQPWQVSANRDCTYEAVSRESQKVSGLDFNIPLPLYADGLDADSIHQSYKDTYENKNWVLVKRNAQIPNNKVWGLGYDSMAKREMDVMAKASENGVDRWIFAGIGHCNLETHTNCYDPLTEITVYALQAKGTDRCQFRDTDPNCHTYDNVTGVAQSPDPNFWVFNVYVLEQQLIDNNGGADYSSDDLPCWLTQCLEGDIKADIRGELERNKNEWNASCQKGIPPPVNLSLSITPRPTTALGRPLSANEAYPPSFVYRWWVKNPPPYPTGFGQLATYLWFAGKTDALGSSSVSFGTLDGHLGKREVTFTVSLKRLESGYINDIVMILSNGGNHYLYVPTDFSDARQGENPKLRTFKPTVGYVYQWWYPSCKPVIYLYPEKETAFDISLKPFGIITQSIPHYPFLTGWKNVSAKPSGELTYQGNTYESLYFEGRTLFVKAPKEGFTIKGAELPQFFEIILPKLGLNGKEITDFKTYWLARLKDENTYYFIGILPREEIDRVEGLTVSPSPDTLVRVRLFFKQLASYEFSSLPDLPVVPERKGTTVVDWGGFFKN